MQQKFLNDPDSIAWLRSTHLSNTAHEFRSFIMTGSEDAPEKLELYTDSEPAYTDAYWEVEPGTTGEWEWRYIDEAEAYKRWEAGHGSN